MGQGETKYWVVLCWDRVLAGPSAGVPWLFILPAHAEAYAAQLNALSMDAAVHGYEPKAVEWRGTSLIQHPPIPRPYLESDAHETLPLSSAPPAAGHHDETHNGATLSSDATDAIQPPPALLE